MKRIDWCACACLTDGRGNHLLYLSISGSWSHQVGLISETFSWDVSQLGLRSEVVIVYWTRLGCSVQFWELLLQSTDCNDGEPSMWQHWLHQPVSASTFHVRYLFLLWGTASIRLCHLASDSQLLEARLTNLQFNFISVSIIKLFQCLIRTGLIGSMKSGWAICIMLKYISNFLLAA